MFDDKSQDDTTPPGNLPTEPEDIFSGVEEKNGGVVPQPVDNAAPNNVPAQASAQPKTNDALSSGRLVKKDPELKTMPNDLGNQAQELNKVPAYKVSEPVVGKALLALLVLIVIAGVVLGGWWAYAKFFKKDVAKKNGVKTPTTTQVAPVAPKKTAPIEKKETNTASTVNTSTKVKSQIDNDNILFGQGVDTDKDGLDDVREIQLKTDPKKADTDGDELNDGDEVLYWNTDPLKKDTDGDGYPDGREIKFGYNPLGPGKLVNILKKATSTKTSTSTN